MYIEFYSVLVFIFNLCTVYQVDFTRHMIGCVQCLHFFFSFFVHDVKYTL